MAATSSSPAIPRTLTLIVAATRQLGIGKDGALPWPSLKNEMAYFARVTRTPPPASVEGTRNTVVMGRRTWDSIPARFRPLKGRRNIVISRSMSAPSTTESEPLVAPSLEQALSALSSSVSLSDAAAETDRNTQGHVFVIGGSSIYAEALKLPQTRRILLTRIENEFDCDTFFPVDLDGKDARKAGWTRRTQAQLEAFLGEKLESTAVEEGDVKYEFCLYELGP